MAKYARCFRKPVYFQVKLLPEWDYYAIRKNSGTTDIFMKARTREGTWVWCCHMGLSELLREIDTERYVVIPEEVIYD